MELTAKFYEVYRKSKENPINLMYASHLAGMSYENYIKACKQVHREEQEKRDRNKVKRKCAVCGKEFIPCSYDEETGWTGATCCSTDCSNELDYKTMRLETEKKPIRKCAVCGKEVGARAKYCSDECRRKTSTEREKLRIANRGKNKTLTCHMCGKEFKSKAGLARYCSKECRVKARRQQRAADG